MGTNSDVCGGLKICEGGASGQKSQTWPTKTFSGHATSSGVVSNHAEWKGGSRFSRMRHDHLPSQMSKQRGLLLKLGDAWWKPWKQRAVSLKGSNLVYEDSKGVS